MDQPPPEGFDYAAYAAAQVADVEADADGRAPRAQPANPAIANPTAVVASLPSAGAIEAARLKAFDCAALQVRALWQVGRLSWVMRMEDIPGEPFRFAPYVALNALIDACPEVGPDVLAKALGFDRPHEAVDMLEAKRMCAGWPSGHVVSVLMTLQAYAIGGGA